MIQAIGYVRRSTDRQEESLEQQRAKLEAFASSKGWKLVHVYTDDAISGSDLERPGLRSMMQRAESDREVGAVIAWDRNRLARPKDPMDGMNLERRLLSAGKRVLYAASNQEAQKSFASGLLGYVEHYQNGDYLRKLSRDVARGILAQVQKGRWAAGVAPFGYDRALSDGSGVVRRVLRYGDDGSTLVLLPGDGAIVERIPKGQRYRKQDHEEVTLIPSAPGRVRAVQSIFHDYASGVPMWAIRDRLNTSGVRTHTGGLFSIASLHVILDNAAYTGRSVYNKRTASKWHRLVEGVSVERLDQGVEKRPASDWVVVESAWTAIIDEELFAKVKERRRAMLQAHHKVGGSSINAGYLLTGLCVCGVCGGKMVGMTSSAGSKGRKQHRHYICAKRHHGDHTACPKRYTLPADLVEGHILDLIRENLAKLRDNAELHRLIAAEFGRLSGGKSDQREQAQRRLADLDQQSAKLRDHLLAMDAETAKVMGLYDEAKRIGQERQEAEKSLEACGPSLKLPTAEEVRSRSAAAFDRLGEVMEGGTLEERREFIAAYVQGITTDPARGVVMIRMYNPLFTSDSTVHRDG